MTIRKAQEKDISRIIELLGQVLQIHAEIRPDIFIPDTTKYTEQELAALLKDEKKPIYVAVNEEDVCMGYAFCQMKEQPFSNNMVQFQSLFIDDLCVDRFARGQHIGESLFDYVKQEAKRMGCYEVTLNVWAGNTSAEKFYEKMGMKTKERQLGPGYDLRQNASRLGFMYQRHALGDKGLFSGLYYADHRGKTRHDHSAVER